MLYFVYLVKALLVYTKVETSLVLIISVYLDMENVSNSDSRRGDGLGGRTYEYRSPLGRYVCGSEGDAIEYTSKVACIQALLGIMAKYPATFDTVYNKSVNYANIFNSWLMASGYLYEAVTQKNYAKNGHREGRFEVSRTIRWSTREGIVEERVTSGSQSKKEANNESCWAMFKKIRSEVPSVQIGISKECDQIYESDEELIEKLKWLNFWCKSFRGKWKPLPRVQIDTPEKLGPQGDATQSSVKSENTIVTADQDVTIALPVKHMDAVENLTTTEKVHSFPSLTDRWMPLEQMKVSTGNTMGTYIKTYYFPEDFYALSSAPNLTPFETFIYGRMDIEMKIVPNANKFHCGKLVVSSKYDTYQADLIQSGYQSALMRNHVIIDLSSNNEGLLRIPFRFHRPWVRLVKHDKISGGVRPSKWCSVYVQVLSQLQTGPDGPSEINVRAYYRLVNTSFAGMSYRVKVQMMAIDAVLAGAAEGAMRQIIGRVERNYDQIGRSRNQDKPGQFDSTIIIPKPKWNFGTGKGVTDVVSMRVNPHTLSNYQYVPVPTDEPKNFYELARIWGVQKTFSWKQEDKAGAELLDMVIDPTVRNYAESITSEFTPIEYACANFCFWNGTIEIRLDFVSNSFHTGAVQLSAEFGRKTTSTSEGESSSTYTKLFHLGEQKSVEFRVPYIYDTVMRRTTATLWQATSSDLNQEDMAKNITIAPLSQTHFKVKVINELRPVKSAPQNIEVLVFIRAGKNFSCHGLKGFQKQVIRENGMDNFPADGYDINGLSALKFAKAEQTVLTAVETKEKTHKSLNEWREVKQKNVKVVTQMDTGDKENTDSTDNFSEGKCVLPIQTLDCHMSFKDLLRRPYLIIYKTTVNSIGAEHDGFFIPVMPPQISMAPKRDLSAESIWAGTIWQTQAMAICSMFRCWRGSTRYTIVVRSGDAPVYVVYIPHSGVRLLGNRNVNAKEGNPMYAGCFQTEMIIPSVNRVVTIEVPYDTENTWTLMNEEDTKRNFAWRDKGDYNAGHVVIIAEEEIVVDVFWSAGDDFEISNFYGLPLTIDRSVKQRLTDAKLPTVQMDFMNEETSTTVPSFLSSQVKRVFGNKKNLVRMAASCVPVVGSSLVMASVANDVDGKMGDIVHVARNMSASTELMSEGITDVTYKVGRLSDLLGAQITDISSVLRNAIDSVSSTFNMLSTGTVLLYDMLLDLLMAWMEKSWRIVGVSLVRFISKIFVLNTTVADAILSYGYQLATYLQSWFETAVPMVQMPNADRSSTLVGILLGLVGTVVGVSMNSTHWRNLPKILLERLTSTTGVSYLVHVLRYIQGIFEVVRDMIMEALGYVSPQARALKLLAENNERVAHFIREAQILTSEANVGMVKSPRFRLRFWRAVLEAHYYQKILSEVPTNVVSTQLARLCSEMVKCGNEKFLDISASPVRYEPFVVCIEGASGIGKSSAVERIVAELLRSTGHTSTVCANTFYRTPNQDFWSGYTNQPVIVYDEWLNTRDSQRNFATIDELMRLKSTSLFIPPMAELADKNRHGNPLIVIILTNDAFPNLGDYATLPEATFRRRDVVLRANLKDEFKGRNLRDCMDEIPNFEHLEFQLYKSSSDRNSLIPDKKSYIMLNAEGEDIGMLNYLKKRWMKYHAQEELNVKRRMSLLPELAESTTMDTVYRDPFTLFYQLNARVQEENISQNAWTPYEQLEMAVQETINIITVPPQVENVTHDYEVVWEEMTAPQAQSVTSFMVGFIYTSPLGQKIANLTLHGLEKLESMIWSREMPERTCQVCDEVSRVVYVCQQSLASENPHYTCGNCIVQWRNNGHVDCAICRSTPVIPMWSTYDISALHIWSQLVLKGVRGMKWMVTKILEYFQWRNNHIILRVVIDSILNMIYLIYQMRTMTPEAMCVQGLDVGFMNGLRYGGYMTLFSQEGWFQPITNLFVQVDSWDEDVEGEPVVPTVREIMAPSINEEVFASLIGEVFYDANDNVDEICLHTLLEGKANRAQLIGDKWRLPDNVTNRMIEIPIQACTHEQCFVRTPLYRTFCEHYLRLKSVNIRHAIIDYINDPSEEHRLLIPKLYCPEWIKPVEIKQFTWWEKIREIGEKYKWIFQAISGIIIVIGTVIGVYKFATRVTTEVQNSGLNGSPEQSARVSTRSMFGRRSGQVYNFQPRSQIVNSNALPLEVSKNYVERNTYRLELRGEKTIVMYGVGLFGHTLLIPKHYVMEIQAKISKGYLLYGSPLLQPQMVHKLNLMVSDFSVSADTDIAYCKLPPSVPLFKDIRKFIATDQDLERVISADATLLVVPTRGSARMREVDVELKQAIGEKLIMDQNSDTMVIRDVLEYNYSCIGACGSLLFIPNTQRPIIGMHCAGTSEEGHLGLGYSVTITQEAIAAVVQGDLEPSEEEDKELKEITTEYVFEDEVQVVYKGVVSKEETPYIPTHSKLEKSLLYGKPGLQTIMEPAILHKTDSRYMHADTPLFAGCKAHGKLTEDFTTADLDFVEEVLWDGWYSKMKPNVMDPKVLTVEEAIVGFPHLPPSEHYKGMDLKTSAGYPYVLTNRKSKIDYIVPKYGENLQMIGVESIDDMVLQNIREKDELRKQRIVPYSVFIDTLKDEKRPHEKVLKYGGTRVFCNSSLDYVISCRMYFMHFIAAFMKQRHSLMHAVGINPLSSEWSLLTKNLMVKNTKFIGIDYTNFGPGYNSGVALRVYRIMIKWLETYVRMTPDEKVIASMIVWECIQSKHIMNNLIYQQVCGSPSGAVFTTIVNTMVNQFYILLAWIALMKKWCIQRNIPLARAFRKYVCFYGYGDDAIMAVSEEVIEYFNTVTITEYFSKYRIVATGADKSEQIKPWLEMSEATFLKRGFMRHPTRPQEFLSPLNWESVLSATQWVWSSPNKKEATRVNVEAAMIQVHGHGPKKFKVMKDLINSYLRELNMDTIDYPWQEIDEKFYTEGIELDLDQFINFSY